MSVRQLKMRTCVGCGLKREQEDLVRFIRSSSGSVIESKRHNLGRGAYLCRDAKERCLIKAIQKRAFDRALKQV